MKVIDIHKYKKSFEDKLTHIEKTLDFSDLKELIAYCLEHKNYNCNDLLGLWNTQKENFVNGDCFWSFCELLKRIRIVYQEEEIPQTSSDDLQSAAQKLVSAFKDLENEIEERKEDYSWFRPSHCLRDLLDEYYPEELNPGKVIATYINLLFPETYPAEYSGVVTDYAAIPYSIHTLPYDSPLYYLLREASVWSLRHTVPDFVALKCYENCLLDLLEPKNREKRVREVELSDVFILLQSAPQEFYYTWIHDCLLMPESTIGSLPNMGLDEFKAALLCFPFGKGNEPLVATVEGYKSLKHKYNKLLSDKHEDIRHNKCLSFASFFWLFYRANEDGVRSDHECDELIRQIITNITEYRHRYLSGVAPFDYYDAGVIGHLIANSVGIADCDLLVLLSAAGFDGGELHLLIDREGALFQEQADFYNKKQQTYIHFFAKAHAEGNHELGTALLSLYIIFRFIFARGNFGNLPELLSAIGKALTLPGAKILKHTLAIVIDSVDRHFSDDPVACYAAMQFRQYLPQGGELRVLPGGKSREGGMPLRDEEEVRSLLMRDLGADRWHRLSENSQICLVSAELLRRNFALEFSSGKRDWSGIITSYCKAIEGELVERLQDFYYCDVYKEYLFGKGRERKQATAGWLLKELLGYEKLPQNLKDVLSHARIMLHMNPDLVKGLYDIFQNYRNMAAHSNAVNMVRFAEFKEKLFEKRLLHGFIDAFCEKE